MEEEIFLKVRSIISDISGIDEGLISDSSDFIKDLNLDPSEKAEMLSSVLKQYAVRLDIEESKNIETVGDLVELINDNLP